MNIYTCIFVVNMQVFFCSHAPQFGVLSIKKGVECKNEGVYLCELNSSYKKWMKIMYNVPK